MYPPRAYTRTEEDLDVIRGSPPAASDDDGFGPDDDDDGFSPADFKMFTGTTSTATATGHPAPPPPPVTLTVPPPVAGKGRVTSAAKGSAFKSTPAAVVMARKADTPVAGERVTGA